MGFCLDIGLKLRLGIFCKCKSLLKHFIIFEGDQNLKKLTLVVTCAKKQVYSSEQIDSLINNLQIEELCNEEEFILVNLHKKALNYLDTHFNKTTAIMPSNGATSPAKKVKSVESDSEEISDNAKKAPMKTAGDVRRRIQWDEEINKEQITVGYLDRFLGIKECRFGAFDWGDIVLADIGALAIPEHRIHYFKYKNEVIWDKNTRLDNVYGSTGSNITIYDVMMRLDAENGKNIIIDEPIDYEQEEVHKLGRAKTPASKLPPNYFISIPIHNIELIENLNNLSKDLIDANKYVENYILPTSSYHMTLCTLRIESSEEIEIAKKCLTDTLAEFMVNQKSLENNKDISLRFEGVDEFFNKVFYVKCLGDQLDKIESLKKIILENFKLSDINISGNYYEFVPHLTIFKIKSRLAETSSSDILSEKKLFQNNKQNNCVKSLVDQTLWQKYGKFYFGEQIFTHIDLCKMGNIFELKTYPVEFSARLDS